MWVEEVEGVEECRELCWRNQVAGENSGGEGWSFCKGVWMTLPTLVVGGGMGMILKR